MNDQNGKRYNLGIDIGTSSLGLVAVDIDSKQIAYMDTIIYREPIEPKGFKLFNVARREKRLVRRQIIRYKDRIRQIHHIFNDLGIGGVDIHKIGKDFDKNRDVIFLRAAAVKEKLSLPELARVILHLVKNRGYKGDLKSEVGDVKKGIKLTQEELLKYNVKTFGELLQKRREDSEKKRKEGSEQTGIAWRNLQEGGTFLARHTVEQEFCYIMFDSEQVDGFAKKFEAEHQNDKNKKEWGYFDCRDAKLKLKYLDFETTYKVENKKFFAGVLQDDINKYLDAIYYATFYQRPVIWDKNTIGTCNFVNGVQYVIPKVSIIFNEYRTLQKIMDLRIVKVDAAGYKVKNTERKLTFEEVKKIKDELNRRVKEGRNNIEVDDIYTLLQTDEDYKFTHDEGELSDKVFDIKGNKTLSYLYKELNKTKKEEDKDFLEHFLNLESSYSNNIDVDFMKWNSENDVKKRKMEKSGRTFKVKFGLLMQEGLLNYWSLLANSDELYMEVDQIQENIKSFCYGNSLNDEDSKIFINEVYNLLIKLRECSFFSLLSSKKDKEGLDSGRSEMGMYATKIFAESYLDEGEYDKYYSSTIEKNGKNYDIKNSVIDREMDKGNFSKPEEITELKPIDDFGIRNPIVKRSLEELRKSVLEAIKVLNIKYNGNKAVNSFEKITVEVTREMKTPPSERNEINSENNKKKNENEKYNSELVNNNLTANTKNLEKYKLWEEQGRVCAYCSKVMGMQEMVNEGQVDHIIPTAKNGSNTLFNKVLAHGSCNNKKSDKTPQQAIEARIFSKEVIDSLVEKLQKQRDLDKDHKRCAKKKNKECSCYFGKKIARLKLQGAVADTDMEAMERAFNETSYIGKYLNEWLNPLTNSKEEKEVHNKNVTTGKITAFLRRHMGVDDLLEEIRINEHKPLINKDGVFFSKALKDEIKAEKDAIYVNNRGMDYYQKEGHFLHVLKEKAEHRGLKKWADFIFYKRIDHRHHLIDAAMIAITSRGLINAAQRFYSKVGSLDGKYVEEYDKVNG